MQQLPQRKLVVIMFMDIVGYTSMVQESEQRALEFVRIHTQTVEEYASKYKGKVVNYYGDASMSMFDSAVDAVQCAVELQRAYHNDYNLPMRIGLHLGEVVLENDTIYGNGVNIASRLESLGIPGSVLISGSINKELENQDSIQTTFIGNCRFKNVAELVKIYAIDDKQLVLPTSKELRSEKGDFVKSMNSVIFITFILLSALFGAFFYFKKANESQSKEISNPQVKIAQEKIIVPPFKNYSGSTANDFIGEMVAHRITKELFEIEGADVIDFQTSDQIAQVKYMSFGSSEEGFAKQSGAVNILEGNFSIHGVDSLMFSVFIKRLSDNSIVQTFPDVFFPVTDPISGISNLTSYITGYWQSKNQKLLSFPKLGAYKLYLKAKKSWQIADELTESYLMQAIDIDPDFYDVYDLLLAHYYNTGKNEKAKDLLAVLYGKLDEMTAKEQNAINQMDAVFNGDNTSAFKFSKIQYEANPKDLFMNTGHMVISHDFVHNYQETISAFEEIDITELNISECTYCEDRLGLALLSYLGLGDLEASKQLLNLLPPAPNKGKSHSIQLRYYAMVNDIDNIKALIQEATEGKLIRNANWFQYTAARELFIQGRFEEAKDFATALLNDVKTINEMTNWAHYFINDLDNAEIGFKTTYDKYNYTRDLSQLGVIAAKKGETEKAWDYIADIENLKEFNFGDTEYFQARIYVHLGEKQKALQLLEAAVHEGARFYAFHVFENDPDLISLRDDPEFNRIIFPMK